MEFILTILVRKIMRCILKLTILVILCVSINSCGRRGKMQYPGGQEMPTFERVIDPGNDYEDSIYD